jgi:hypothetical protein
VGEFEYLNSPIGKKPDLRRNRLISHPSDAQSQPAKFGRLPYDSGHEQRGWLRSLPASRIDMLKGGQAHFKPSAACDDFD